MDIWLATWGTSVDEMIDDFVRFEAAGVDGVSFSDSQNLWLDTWVALTVAARETSRIQLSPVVTNPLTRHPVVTASAAASLQEISHGRVKLGIGRGDSALAYLGFGAVPLARFTHYVEQVQGYLRGEEVEFDDTYGPGIPPITDLGYQTVPSKSKIQWLPSTHPKVPVEIAASGPRVLRLASMLGEGAILGMGIEHDRLRNAIEVVKSTRLEQNLSDDFTVAAIIPVIPHSDRNKAADLAAGVAASTGRWSVMQGANRDTIEASTREQLVSAREAYDMTRHSQTATSHAAVFSKEMTSKFAVYGTPDECIEQLKGLEALGIDRIIMPPRIRGGDVEDGLQASRLLIEEVLPTFTNSKATIR